MYINNHKTIYSLLCIILCCYGFFWFRIHSVSGQDNLYTSQQYIQNNLSDIDKTREGLKPEDKNTYNIMKKLCNNLIWSQWNYGIYNPKESVFVTIVCNSLQTENFNKTSENIALDFNKFLKQKNIRSMWLICSTSQWGNTAITETSDCTPWTTKNTFDYPRIFQQIIAKIQNDIVNLSMARIYGSIDITESDSLALANIYIANHFFTAGVYPEQKNYPQTVKQLRDYIKIGQQIQKETYFLDYKKMIDSANTELLLQQWLRWPFILATYKKEISDPLLKDNQTYHGIAIDLMYNELFFYTLFMSVYNNYLWRFRSEPDDVPISIISMSRTSDMQSYRILEYNQNKKQNNDIAKATRDSIREIENLDAQFPLHIWLLMYQEDLYKIRNSLANIYLPLHQLHYKLENVQSKD